MVANLVREALKQEIKDTKIKKQRDPEDSCKELAAGRCKHSFSGTRHGGCPQFHPKICDQIKAGSKVCNIENCHLTHPPVCETYKNSKVIYEKEDCLKQHRKLEDWHFEQIPIFAEEGGWDGFFWRKPSKKIKKIWIERNQKKDDHLSKKGAKEVRGPPANGKTTEEQTPHTGGPPTGSYNGGGGGRKGGGGGRGGGGGGGE